MKTQIETPHLSFGNAILKAFVAVSLLATVVCSTPGRPIDTKAKIRAERSAASAKSFQIVQSGAVVLEWNQNAVMLTLGTTPALAPIQQSRIMATVQTAVHDAVNGISGEYATYLPRTTPPANASPEAAAIAAAYRALRGFFNSAAQQSMLDGWYTNSLTANGIPSTDPGLAYGMAVADALLAARADDGAAQAQFPYDGPSSDPGVWRLLPGQTALLPGWGDVTPFVLHSGSQFRPGAPPALGSDIYAKDYNEIKEIGSTGSTTRTALQSQIGLFWRASPTAIWNPILRQALAERTFDLSTTARAFALLYLASSDAGVACWDAKYVYNYWRPQSAIRRGHEDGNDLTTGDPSWTPFLPTPPHPEYPSGHSTKSAAIGFVLESLFGEGLDAPITVTVGGITREWNTFDEGIEEVIDARVYSGIHFRNSDIVGAKLGRHVAQFVMTHALRPCRGRGTRCS